MQRLWFRCPAVAVGLLLLQSAAPSWAQFTTVNLVTDDQSAHAAQITDPGLLNAWGMSYSSTSPFWVSSNGGGTSTIYRVNPLTQVTTIARVPVTIPGAGNPTGQVFNSGGASQFGGDAFLFVSEDGTVSGWQPSFVNTAQPVAGLSALYKGAAFGSVGGNSYLYAADFHNGTINVFKGTVAAPSLTGSFTDPNLPKDFAPFNVQALAGSLYVAYAKQDPNSPDEVAGPGVGFVDQFDLQGNLVARVASHGTLNAPWGMAIAPDSFGTMAGALLVGNFGNGRISAFDPTTHAFLGLVMGADGKPLSIDGLWALGVGNDGGAGSSHRVYFTAGPDDESHGLFGVLAAVPEPGSVVMLAAGLAIVFWRMRARDGNGPTSTL